MVEIAKDRKSESYIVTTTDGDGFHRQIYLSKDDAYVLFSLLHKLLFN